MRKLSMVSYGSRIRRRVNNLAFYFVALLRDFRAARYIFQQFYLIEE